ncbi:MAG TPA: heterodisulfide reductase-related iron-sulfur binding cluster, partial [Ilumatobacter sp.]|nr:heterodisulfide reductase-related iron-sulfur binding cluster [Ilumatobacter sp.]
MTITYDPSHAAYVDEADTRGELTRVFNVCDECRRCVSLCSTFPSLFDTIDGHTVQHDDRDAGRLTPEQQDRVVGQCFQCKLCAVDCPYAPGRHERQIDLPRLMLRAEAMRRANGHDAASRRSTRALINTGLINTGLARTVTTSFSSAVNRVTGAPAGSPRRRLLAWLTGLSAVRRLPTLATQRFSSWCRLRDVHTHRVGARSLRPVVVYPTCLVELHQPAIGRDMVQVYERNGIDCALSQARCCGAALLHAGNVKKFSKAASANVELLADEVRGGHAIVVPEPMCSHVVRHDYPMYVQSPDAELVAENTFDACEYLMRVQADGESGLETDFV